MGKIFKGESVPSLFNWKSDGTDKYLFTVTEGNDENGASLKGKEIVVTFDAIHNAFLDTVGTTFVRPTGSIKDKIPLN